MERIETSPGPFIQSCWVFSLACAIALTARAAEGKAGDDAYWTKEKIEFFNKKYGIHDMGYHYHYPRKSFLQYGYYPPGGYVKDFCILKHDSRWHVFHIDGRCEQICWITGNEIAFGHCSTDDFQHWLRHPMPLAIGDSPYDNKHIWAPFVYPHGNQFYMFYMSEGSGGTCISCATSKDLESWKKRGPIPTAKGRDPFLFKHEGKFILVFTAHYEVNQSQALGACSSPDLENWTRLPEIILTKHGGPESASIHPIEGGKFVLWVNDWGDSSPQHPTIYRAAYVVSDNPLHFNGENLTSFKFVKGPDEVPLDPEWNEPNGMYTQAPGAMELIAKGNNKTWLVSYYRIVGKGFRLFLGELDWNTTPATIREIHSEADLHRVLKLVPAASSVGSSGG